MMSCSTDPSTADSQADFLEILRADGVVNSDSATLTPLTGGVSSEIYRVDDGDDTFVVKRALAKLKVKDDWFADVSRNFNEQQYLEYVGGFLPEAVPTVRAANAEHGYFAMEYLPVERFANWKQQMLAGEVKPATAHEVGRILGVIHQRSSSDPAVREKFNTLANFEQLRIEPYLLTTGQRHPELKSIYFDEAERLRQAKDVLVHGDFSPKNILVSPDRIVLVDCEVAWCGDAAFDLAFLFTHLHLKALHHAPKDLGLRDVIHQTWRAYSTARFGDEAGESAPARTLEQQVTHLTQMILLARVDGKSPAEYLTPDRQQFVRQFISEMLPRDCRNMHLLTGTWFAALVGVESRP